MRRNHVHLPEEIVLEILYRLPAKSLGRCKCVSKSWRTLISASNFIETHLSLANRRSHRSLLLVDEGSLFIVEFSGEPDTIVNVSPERLNFQQTYNWHKAYCSFNGLVLALNSHYELFVLNPRTQDYKKLPQLYNEDLAYESLLGFGYDSTTNDYKVVVISYPNTVYVYRFKSDFWEMLPRSPLDHGEALSYNESGVFLNNSLHWFVEISSPMSSGIYFLEKSSKSSILAFDMADETFWEVPLPNQFDRLKTRVLSTLGVVDGCLCIVCQDDSRHINGRVDVWVMNKYGVESSWTKFNVYQSMGVVNPVYFWGNKEFTLITGKEEVAICNVKENESKYVIICGIQSVGGAKAVVHCSFLDSLVHLEQLQQGTNALLSDDDEN